MPATAAASGSSIRPELSSIGVARVRTSASCCGADRQPVRRQLDDAGEVVAGQRRDAHHEEFVEVVRGNRQKLDAFEEWMAVGARLVEDAFVECEPAHLTVEVERRIRELSLWPGRTAGATLRRSCGPVGPRP